MPTLILRQGVMTPRQRVARALRRQEPDRVPINYMCNPGIDGRLKAHFGLEARDDEGLRRAIGVDFRGLWTPYKGPRLHPEVPGVHVDPQSGIRTRWIEHSSGGYWDYCDFPLADADDQTIANWPLPSPDDFDYGSVPAACARHGDMAIHVGGAGTGDIMNSTGMIMGVEQMMMNLAAEHEATMRFIDRRVALQLEVAQRTIEAADGRVDFLWMGEDLGTQRGPLISLDMYRRVIRPRHQKFVDLARRFNLPVMIHTCGSSSWAYDDMIEMGISAVDTLQPEAADMSPAYLKKRFGDRLAFHGCISTAGVVSGGTVEAVREDVRQTLKTMMPGGGYMLSPTHALQDNSPTENVIALYETAHAEGWYV